MLPTHDVPCPQCGAALYTSLSLDDGIPSGNPESPPVYAVGECFYMRCPRCLQQVEMERYTAEGREAFRLAGREGTSNRLVHDSRP